MGKRQAREATLAQQAKNLAETLAAVERERVDAPMALAAAAEAGRSAVPSWRRRPPRRRWRRPPSLQV